MRIFLVLVALCAIAGCCCSGESLGPGEMEVSGEVAIARFPLGPAATGFGWMLVTNRNERYILKNPPSQIDSAELVSRFRATMVLRQSEKPYHEVIRVLSVEQLPPEK